MRKVVLTPAEAQAVVICLTAAVETAYETEDDILYQVSRILQDTIVKRGRLPMYTTETGEGGEDE